MLKKTSLLLKVITIFFINIFLASIAQGSQITVPEKLAALEASAQGRLGVYAINTADNSVLQYRADERFPMCSTFKAMAVAAILKQSITDSDLLQQRVTYTKEDTVRSGYSPVTGQHIADGMTVSGLCAAAMTQSDSAAINVLMQKLGGPGAVTAFARSIGDDKFRLDRWEPELNSAIPGDLRDTSTPAAAAQSLQRLALGDVLALPQRQQFQAWLKANATGNFRIRAGVPKGWVVGDKTGSGHYGETNDIGVIWPPNRPPIVIAIYFAQDKKNAPYREDVIASATRIVIDGFNY